MFLLAFLLVISRGIAPAALVRERTLDLAPSAWEPAPGVKLESANGLRARSDETSVSLRLIELLPLASDTQLTLDVPINFGEVTVQAEWFASGSKFLGAKDLARLQGPIAGREISVGEAPARANAFGIKLWFASTALDTTISSIKLRQRIDWPADQKMTTLAERTPQSALATDGSLSTHAEGSAIRLALGAQGTGAAHFDESVPFHSEARILLAVEKITPRTGVTLQILFFDALGDYVGDRALIADITSPGDYVTRIEYLAQPPPPSAKRATFKLWLSGEPGSMAVINGLMYGKPTP